jgi:uncharacterized protein (TIGR02265 family)
MTAPPPRRTLDQSSIEATLRGAGVLDDPTVLAVLAAAGYDPQRPSPAYDWSIHEVLEAIIPSVLGWTGTHNEHMYRLGRATFIGWGKTIVGRVLSAPLGQATPQRALQIMARLLSLNPLFGTHTLTERGPRDFQITATDDPRHPWFVAGLVIPAIEVSGGQEIRWIAQASAPEAYTIEISWATDGLPFQRVTL